MATERLFNVPEHWDTLTLGAACARGGGDVQTGPFGSQLHASDYVPNGIPSIMPQNIGDNRIIADGIARITVADAERLSRYRVKQGDIIYSRRGDVERRALVRVEEDGWLCGTGCLRVRFGSGIIIPEYGAYYLGHPAAREWIVRHAVGATMPNLNTSILSSLPFVIPPRAEQERIVEILGSFDNKIDLNRRMNQTLEAMAQALFRSWFVDFDPVRAKVEGRLPEGMDEEAAALFPKRFVDSELGKLPDGWLLKKVSDVVEGVFDGPHATPPTANHGPIFLGIKNLTGTAIDLSDARYINEADWPAWTKRVEPRPGDIVFTYEATLGHFALIPPGLRCCLGRRTALVRPQSDCHFLFHWFVGETFQKFLKTRIHPGATVDRILLTDFPSYPVLSAPQPLVDRFEALAAPIWSKIHANQSQNQVLVDLRDTLLPKLLSGDTRVGEAEAQVAASA